MHFTVLVVGDNLEEQLAPFQENNMGDCPAEHMEFEPIDLVGEGYKTVAEAVADNYEEHEGKAGFWTNPNSFWDWYVLGGRWQGMIRLKGGAAGEKGRPGTMGAPDTDPLNADSALVKDIDFEGMYNEAMGKAGTRYDLAMGIFGELPVNKTFEEVFNETKESHPEGTPHSELRNIASDLYQKQPRIVALATAREVDPHLGISADDFVISKEDYVANAAQNRFITNGILHNGEHSSADHMEKDEFRKLFKETLEGLTPDTRLSIVDCHV